jgi:hypothetical protein
MRIRTLLQIASDGKMFPPNGVKEAAVASDLA